MSLEGTKLLQVGRLRAFIQQGRGVVLSKISWGALGPVSSYSRRTFTYKVTAITGIKKSKGIEQYDVFFVDQMGGHCSRTIVLGVGHLQDQISIITTIHY